MKEVRIKCILFKMPLDGMIEVLHQTFAINVYNSLTSTSFRIMSYK